jgi:ABC-type branched-subunit amino acid transport system substrate-binding protein
MMHRITRREFVELSTLSLGGFVVSRSAGTKVRPSQTRTLNVATILPPADDKAPGIADVDAGASMAFSETQRAAELFGQKVQLSAKRVASSDQFQGVAHEFIERNSVHVIIGGMSEGEALALAAAAEGTGAVFLNVGSSADSLRKNECSPRMFHIAASDSMTEAARAAAMQQLTAASTGIAIQLWDASLERYGASQLNDRYRARFGRAMTSPAWAGWFAMKIAWETSLKARSADPAVLAGELAKRSTQFDGHKGAPLSFRTSDHQLRQPLYAVGHDAGGKMARVVAELPDVGKASAESLREQLDRFAGADSTAMCRGRK